MIHVASQINNTDHVKLSLIVTVLLPLPVFSKLPVIGPFFSVTATRRMIR